ncbi:ribosome biogenesis GTP-binding protein YihA/YsxC [Dolosigranulum pigrum]|uniref:ribosome biogenesis GTP-binding protein YihA/YsxC n=1 Tax=Dolosigranulum pigrum TaxID=29394 RepID=UPI0019185698|nr:ribosome biogenesis GTP-binding protein YihA/YsxC [Dolosigranulum pigrum]QTJ54919.1 YihA family ribosome biogenesis GTP-binding protein [Dolosigranulum pigrum]
MVQVNYADILISAVRPEQYPNEGLPEIALAGRSNVGKSSFINTMINRKKLARTSSKPGKTRTLNFFNINHDFLFVDVPGYGYAKVSKSEREKWSQMMEDYFSAREELSLVVQIVDFRHEPTELDIQMYEYLKYFDLPVLIVATKADKIKKSRYNKHLSQLKKALNVDDEDHIVIYSSHTLDGKEEAWSIMLDYIRND